MGKYIRKGKGVGKMPEGSLGVRTRARVLALQKDHSTKQVPSHSIASDSNSFKLEQDTDSHSADCGYTPPVSSTPINVPVSFDIPRQEQPHQYNYMELRSRRLEKISRPPFSTSRQQQQQQACISYHHHRGFHRSSISKCSNSEDESTKIHASSHVHNNHVMPGSTNASPSRQFCLQTSAFDAGSVLLKRVTPTGSTSNSVSMTEKVQPLGILTRHRRQELASMFDRSDMDIEGEVSMSRKDSHHSHIDKGNSAEVEQFFGESPIVGGPSNKERRRRGTRENTPDSYVRSMDAPGSTSRTRHSGRGGRSLSAPPFNRANEAPSSTEIEAFFQGAEQQERRRFIERYNFDPANERPLRGRYEWMSM